MVAMASVLQEMRADPLAFLRHYLVFIAGGAAAKTGTPSGQATFSFFDRTMTGRGFTRGVSGLFGKKKDRPVIGFTKISKPPKSPLGNNEFNAWYVAMAELGANVSTTHFSLPGSGGPDIMLTSQLSGCTFGVGSSAGDGSRLVSHIQPADGATDDTTRTNLHSMMLAGLNNDAPVLFERENQGGSSGYGNRQNRATIIGVRQGSAWSFYAQTFRAGGENVLLKAEKL